MTAAPADPLVMAENCVAAVEQLARYATDDPVGSFVHRGGEHGARTAELAGNLALVSIARDLRRAVDTLQAVNQRE